jgi:hypothetical protein
MAACYYHGDRPGVGLCMRCRRVICEACCTRVDGINHCHACLKALAGRAMPGLAARNGRAAGPSVGPLVALMLFGLSALVLMGLGWLGQGLLAP